MKYFAFLSLLLAVSFVSAFNQRGHGNSTLQRKRFLPVMRGIKKNEASSYRRIIRGEDAPRGHFPFMVGLKFVHNHYDNFCGGALIAQTWVLTAAHCTIGAQSVRVFLGMHTKGRPGLEYWVSSNHIVTHEDYNSTLYTADIALVLIPRVEYTNVIGEVPLPRKTFFRPKYAGKPAITMGWGAITANRHFDATTLQYITLTVIRNSKCEETYGKKTIYRGKMCTSGERRDGPCEGDSGGPLVSSETGPLIGIISFGSRAGCASGDPEAYTRVYHYLTWINGITGIPI